MKRLSQSQADLSAWIILIACVAILSISLCGCTIPRKAKETEPIGPYHIKDPLTANDPGFWHPVSNINDPGFYKESIPYQPPCDHFWIKSAIEINDPFGSEFKDGETIYSPCICLHCKEKSICK